MSGDLLAEFRIWVSVATAQDRACALKAINKQIELTALALEDVAKNSMDMKNNEIWASLFERRNLEIAELLQITDILKSPMFIVVANK